MLSVRRIKHHSWACIHYAESKDVCDAMEELNKDSIKQVTVDCSSVMNDLDLFKRLSNALSFPEYFGENWDALDECLRDLDWVPRVGCVLFVFGADVFWKTATYTAGKFVTSWLGAAEEWGNEHVPFHLVFVLSDSHE